jgi:GH15 family glucan-1,4-alpha-glucosidase
VSSANAWYEWYQYTSDLGFIAKWWPAIKRDISYGLSFLDNTTGLIIMPGNVSLNYDYYDGQMPGEHTSANSIMVWALRNAALMADSLGDSELAAEYRTTSDGIHGAVNQRLYSEGLGGYVVTNEISGAMSQDGNSVRSALDLKLVYFLISCNLYSVRCTFWHRRC